jgi:transcription elongation GreA/GreB family factor
LLLENVEIIKKGTGKVKEVVGYWSVVELEFDEWKIEVIELVWSGEVSVDGGLKVSFQSPLGTAIREKKVWDTVKIMMAGSRKEVKIKKIS